MNRFFLKMLVGVLLLVFMSACGESAVQRAARATLEAEQLQDKVDAAVEATRGAMAEQALAERQAAQQLDQDAGVQVNEAFKGVWWATDPESSTGAKIIFDFSPNTASDKQSGTIMITTEEGSMNGNYYFEELITNDAQWRGYVVFDGLAGKWNGSHLFRFTDDRSYIFEFRVGQTAATLVRPY